MTTERSKHPLNVLMKVKVKILIGVSTCFPSSTAIKRTQKQISVKSLNCQIPDNKLKLQL